MNRRNFWGEMIGTYIMVVFGTGAVAVTTLFGAHQGLFQIAMIWGLALTIAIYLTRKLSCAHFNPAVSVAMVASGRMNKNRLPVYFAGQFLGAFLAALTIYLLFSPSIAFYESSNGIIRGTFESVATAKMFGEYYIQPGNTAVVSLPLAMAGEAFGTFILTLAIFLLTECCNLGKPDDNTSPLFIGITLTTCICLIAPLTQAGFNPARDFAPRLVALMFGWGKWAMPDGIGGFFWVYMLSPVIGSLLAAALFVKIIEPQLNKEELNTCDLKL